MGTINNKRLNIALWIAQVLLGVAFIMAGAMKSFSPVEEIIAKGITWAVDLPTLVRFIGISELLGGIGLILPAALRIKPILTAWAAAALSAVMLLAVGFHLMQGDTIEHTLTPAVLGLIALFIAWGRFAKVPIWTK